MQRRQYIFHGRVQGVGFRATAVSIARRFPITGRVQNLPNGTVELFAQGDQSPLDAFLAEIQSQFTGYVTHVDHCDVPVVPNESGFQVGR